MGRPNPVLTIWVADDWLSHPAVVELLKTGHVVYAMSEVEDYASCTKPDLILHPAAHWWCDEMFEATERPDGTLRRPYLEAALVRARARRKGKK